MLLKTRPVSPALPAMMIAVSGLALAAVSIKAEAEPAAQGVVQFIAQPVIQAIHSNAPVAADANDIQAGLATADNTLPPDEQSDLQSEEEKANALDVSDEDFQCLAKIVHHEAGNQPESVQLAVANVVLNRLNSKKFPTSICGIGMQPGQFFNVRSYRPRSGNQWETAQRVARAALDGQGRTNAPGALYFRSAGYKSTFFRSRPQVAVLGDMAFHH